MAYDRITWLRIGGMRCLEDVALDLRGLLVLIGDNGSGKSTILEALELLRQAAKPVNYVPDIITRGHGGLHSLLRYGSEELAIGVRVEGAGTTLEYDFAIAEIGFSAEIVAEQIRVVGSDGAVDVLLEREGRKARIRHRERSQIVEKEVSANALALAVQGIDFSPEIERLAAALVAIEVHPAFETRSLWQQQELDMRIGPRRPTVVEAGQALARYGANLSNCFQVLRNQSDEVLDRVRDQLRLGLGPDFRDFRLRSPQAGHIVLDLIYGSAPDRPVAVESLSEGQIAYLCFIALAELNKGRSILAIDEPELHLHPGLLARVVGMMEEVAQTCPVVLSTHSDRLLDCLANPADSVVLCDLDERRGTQLQRPNPERLKEWLDRYRGLGSVRADGYEAHVFDEGPRLGGAEKA